MKSTWCYQDLCLVGPHPEEGQVIDGVQVPHHGLRLIRYCHKNDSTWCTDLGGDALHQGGHLGGGGVVHGSLGHNTTGVDHDHSCYSFVVLESLQGLLQLTLALG